MNGIRCIHWSTLHILIGGTLILGRDVATVNGNVANNAQVGSNIDFMQYVEIKEGWTKASIKDRYILISVY